MTLDEDVAAKLKAETRRSGKSFKQTVNEMLRLALNRKRPKRPQERFRVRARELGDLRPGLSLDNIAELLERVEGPLHR